MVVQSAPIQTISIHLGYSRAKRLLDIAFTLLILPLLLLVSIIITVLIKLDSKGPLFFRQKRVGRNGVEFEMLKFRSMYIDNDDSTHRDDWHLANLWAQQGEFPGNGPDGCRVSSAPIPLGRPQAHCAYSASHADWTWRGITQGKSNITRV